MVAPFSIKQVVEESVVKVLQRGEKFAGFDKLRQRHIYSTHLFAPGGGGFIEAKAYELFIAIPGTSGQDYPVPLTLRETNFLNIGRVPDQQNFVVAELGCTVMRPPGVESDVVPPGPNAPTNGIWFRIPSAIRDYPADPTGVGGIAASAPVHPADAANVLDNMVVEFSYLTNNVPIGKAAYFSQSAGAYVQEGGVIDAPYEEEQSADWDYGERSLMGDPNNGIAAAAFRRKFEIPQLLAAGQNFGMRLNVHSPIQLLKLTDGGTGWLEVRIDLWVTESFKNLS